MAYRKRVKEETTDLTSVQYQNKVAQLISLVGARRTFVHLGRGSAKTTDVQCERLIDLMFDMPGAPVVWVASTFTDLQSNILPAVLEGLERKGYIEGVHFVVEQKPPTFTDKEKEGLPDWLKPHFWKPFNKLATYKRTIVFFTGLNIRFGSLDRPSSLAGGSFVFVFGDEGKYFNPTKIANLLKANRGYFAEYGHCVFYRGVMFTSDLADTSHIGEYDWMEQEAKNLNIEASVLVMRAGMVYNDALHEYVAAKEKWMRTQSMSDLIDCRNKLRTANRWKMRWIIARKHPDAATFYIRASSYVNADILTAEWFSDAMASGLPDIKTAILSLRPTLSNGDRFYSNLQESHFYFDGIDEKAYDKFSLKDAEDCRVLRYLDPDAPLRAGVDFGNMCSMSVAQPGKEDGRDVFRVLKFIYTLAPDYLKELGEKFRKYFAPHRRKILKLYYDRAGNSYKEVKKDQVSELKKAIEYDSQGRRTGWTVHLMSLNQGNLRQAEEYNFMQIFMSGRNPQLPLLRIDAYACKNLKQSLQLARTKVKDGIVFKDKSSERLPISDLPTQSTNPSDSFKYLMMTEEFRRIVKHKSGAVPGNIDVHQV